MHITFCGQSLFSWLMCFKDITCVMVFCEKTTIFAGSFLCHRPVSALNGIKQSFCVHWLFCFYEVDVCSNLNANRCILLHMAKMSVIKIHTKLTKHSVLTEMRDCVDRYSSILKLSYTSGIFLGTVLSCNMYENLGKNSSVNTVGVHVVPILWRHVLRGQIPPQQQSRVRDNNCVKHKPHPIYPWNMMVPKQIFAICKLWPWPWWYDPESRSWLHSGIQCILCRSNMAVRSNDPNMVLGIFTLWPWPWRYDLGLMSWQTLVLWTTIVWNIQIQLGNEELWPGHGFSIYVHCELGLGEMNLGQGNDTHLGCGLWPWRYDLGSRSLKTLGSWIIIVWNIIQILLGSEELRPWHGFWVCKHCDLNLGDMTLVLGHDTTFVHGH